MITGRTVESWLKDKKIGDSEPAVNAALPYTSWHSKALTSVFDKIAAKG